MPVALPHGAFLQATAEGEAALVAAVREAVGKAGLIADLFAGLGTFALALTGKVYAAEGARDAALALKAAGRGLFVDHRDLFRRPLDVAELNRFEALVLDPPRAGAKEQAPLLAASTLPRIAYVSCNPATFARDAKLLIDGGYRLDWIRPVTSSAGPPMSNWRGVSVGDPLSSGGGRASAPPPKQNRRRGGGAAPPGFSARRGGRSRGEGSDWCRCR